MATSEHSRLAKRSRIIDAAIEVFAEKGFRSARVSDIARIAGVADGTIYLYFRNKDDLLLCIFEEKMELLLADLEQVVAEVDGTLEKMRAYTQQHFDQLQRHPALAQVFQIELRQSHKFLREYRPEKLWAYLGVFGRLVEEGKACGDIRADVDPFVAKWAYFGALDQVSVQWVLSRKRERFNLEQAAIQVVDMFYRGVSARPTAAPPIARARETAEEVP